MAKTTSDIMVECLISWGVDTIFGLPGDQAVHFAKALLRGQKDAGKIIKTIAEDQIREVI
jgi:thiamine pyrophosphate-dependent acetolactate synthase large subunit-like protein